jgi:hypothetical protein
MNFEQVGDDQHLFINKIICTATDMLLLGAASGQVSTFNLTQTGADGEYKLLALLTVLSTMFYGTFCSVVMTSPGFQPSCVVQMHPLSACKDLAYHFIGRL